MSNVKIEKSLTVESTKAHSFMSGFKVKLPKDTGIFIVMIGIALILSFLAGLFATNHFY